MFTTMWLVCGTVCFLLSYSDFKNVLEVEEGEIDFVELVMSSLYHLGGCLITWPYMVAVEILELMYKDEEE